MEITQNQIDILARNLRKKRIKLELLDFNMKTIDSLEGLAIGGSITADADNDIRRSGKIDVAISTNPNAATLLEQLNGLVVEIGGSIWLDKYIKIFVGIDDHLSAENHTNWFNLGVFLINNPIRTFSAQENIISFECIDLMAKLTGNRQGQITSQATIIEQGYYEEENGVAMYKKTKLADAIATTITELGGFYKYSIYPIPEQYQYLPYDIKIGVGATVYDILKELMNVIPTWQMYFDTEGVFIVEPIPSGENSIVYNLDKTQYISSAISSNFENVKNQVVVYGRLNDLTYYTENTADILDNVDYSGDTLILKYSDINIDSLSIGGTTFGFFSLDYANSLPISKVEIYSGGELLLSSNLVKFANSTNSFGNDYATAAIEPYSIEPNEIFFIRVFEATQTIGSGGLETIDISQPIIFEFMGKQSVSYSLVNDNIESPYYINSIFESDNFYVGKSLPLAEGHWGSRYILKINSKDNLDEIENGTIITFMANASNIYASDSNCTKIDIVNKEGSTILSDIPMVQNFWQEENGIETRPFVPQNKISNDYTIWQLRYEKIGDNEWFILVGKHPNAIVKIFSGGEYDNIYCDQLAYERCLYELFLYSNMNDTISIDIVPNYLIDVNCKIQHNPNSMLPKNIYTTQQLLTNSSNDIYKEYQTGFNQNFYVKNDNAQYFLTKQVTYHLGVENTPQTISAIRIYDSGNLIGYNY